MKDIAIYGAGGWGREVALLIHDLNRVEPRWNLLGFFDDHPKERTVDGLPVLGGMVELNQHAEALALVVAVADPATRVRLVATVNNPKVYYPVLVHPTAQVGDARNELGQGSVLAAGSILTTGIRLQEFVIVNLACTIGHDVTIGPYVTLMPGVRVSGFVEVGRESVLGSGCVILPQQTIGACAQVGAGAVVTRPVEVSQTVVGVPAKPI